MMRRRRRQFLPDNALAKIAEALVPEAFADETGQHGTKFGDEIFVFDAVLEDAVQARIGFIAAQVDLIFSGSAANETDFRGGRARAAVRATGHADGNLLILQTDIGEKLLD